MVFPVFFPSVLCYLLCPFPRFLPPMVSFSSSSFFLVIVLKGICTRRFASMQGLRRIRYLHGIKEGSSGHITGHAESNSTRYLIDRARTTDVTVWRYH